MATNALVTTFLYFFLHFTVFVALVMCVCVCVCVYMGVWALFEKCWNCDLSSIWDSQLWYEIYFKNFEMCITVYLILSVEKIAMAWERIRDNNQRLLPCMFANMHSLYKFQIGPISLKWNERFRICLYELS